MKTIELFAGTGSFSQVMRSNDHSIFQVEKFPHRNNLVDLAVDVRRLRGEDFPSECDMLWASPPCTAFSIASVSHHWETISEKERHPKSETARLGLELMRHTIQLITEIQPKWWFIENPRGMMRKVFDSHALELGLTGYERKTVTYCQYGDTRMKPTDIWTNAHWWSPHQPCKNGDPCHEAAPRGSRTGTQGVAKIDRSRIPADLFVQILESRSLPKP